MSHIFRRKLHALLATLLFGVSSGGAAADAGTDWQSGQEAFASGRYGDALAYFEAARDDGLSGPAVHYNIAVCEYSLGNYSAANRTFRLIAGRFPTMRGIAEYNVGLAERRLGNPRAAQRQFVTAYRHSDDEKIRALAVSQLAELEREQRPGWYGLLGIQVGYDDNVALRDSLGLPAGASANSPMADLFATLRGPVPGIDRLQLDGSIYTVTYSDADEFDQVELRVGTLYTVDRADWRLQGGIYGAAGTLGGSSFNREAMLDLRSIRYLGDDSSIAVRLRYNDINSAQLRFDGIEGSRSRIDLAYRWNTAGRYLAVGAGLEENDRRDAGISPSTRRLRTDYGYQVNNNWRFDTAATFRTSDYDDLMVPRSEDFFSLAIRVAYETASDWQISGRYQYSKNDSSDPMYSYDRNLLTVGFQRLF